LPGEEANVHLGPAETPPGHHLGHWIYLFPRPVYWIMRRGRDEPFAEPHPRLGTLYRVGNRSGMLRLLEQERGLAWTAHPRIKASSWAPDHYRDQDFYQSDRWLGGAWKAMPADLSQPRLGTRVLDLIDDMANWGDRKYVLGEVDVFRLNHTHELYGHMNINYVEIDRVPRFEEGWQPVLDALRGGRFFVSTGEVLLHSFRVGHRSSGEVLALPADGRPELKVELSWMFPLRFAEIVSGNGRSVDRQRIDLSGEPAFSRATWTLRPNLKSCRRVRFEVWDIAANGSFSQPVWLEPSTEAGPR
jgi:hypothetical protein